MILESESGLRIQVNENGSIRRIDHHDVTVNLFPGSEMEGGPANLHLRRLRDRVESIPLLGPRSPGRVELSPTGLSLRGEWVGLRFAVSLVLAREAPAWFWHVTLENRGRTAERVDLVHVQDLALTDYGAVRRNEYYVSQYLDYTPLADERRGWLLAVRQNLPVGGRHPWLLLGCLGRGVAFATDALQLHGLATRAGGRPEALGLANLPAKRLQHEHSMAVLQDDALRLEPGARAWRGFFGWLEPDHPEASSPADLARMERALALPEAKATAPAGDGARHGAAPARSLFNASPLLACRELRREEITTRFGGDLREVEGDPARSFFTGAHAHVVLRAKELEVLRPHGQILRSGDRWVPDEASLTSTAWMNGVFHSQVTQGHVGINGFLSATRSYLSLFRSHGLRVFVERDGGWHLLDVPSACEMTPDGFRWIYLHAGGRIEARAFAAVSRHELWLSVEVLDGAPCRFLVSHHVAVGGDDGAEPAPVDFVRDAQGILVRVPADSELGRRFPSGGFRIDPTPETPIEGVGGDELLFEDGRSRREPFLVVVTSAARAIGFRLTGCLVEPARDDPAAPDPSSHRRSAARFWRRASGALELHPEPGSASAGDVARLQEIVPWLAHDALIHYLAPRGLEQFTGGGWGTRDVCQGPVELLLALGRPEPVRDLLLRVFRNQNPDGDWPQWFMFFERERAIRPGDSHGDVVFWPVLALARYLLASEDATILDEEVPFFHPDGNARAERGSIASHAARAVALASRRVVAGTALAAYGHGDWNDSLQPADPSMSQRLCSAWTVTLQVQTLETLATALRRIGRAAEASPLEAQATRVRDDFQRCLVVDGVLAGLAEFHPDGRSDPLLHPRDGSTGLRFSLLAMIHAVIADLFDPAQARAHLALIREHLLGPDGARLFDRPLAYRGGPQCLFQRAESSSFFGREIGIMYFHAHLRYAEAMARHGDAEALFTALRQANPIGIRAAVPCARPRQANCYSSSSDGAFADRYEASARYAELLAGRVPVEAGWRVYSSGPGIMVRVIRECLLGLRQEASRTVIDPVLPRSLDGLRARIALGDAELEVVYRVGARGYGPSALTLDGRPLAFERETHPYREGGAVVSTAALHERPAARLVVELP
jgi:cellobiose phosphorylase